MCQWGNEGVLNFYFLVLCFLWSSCLVFSSVAMLSNSSTSTRTKKNLHIWWWLLQSQWFGWAWEWGLDAASNDTKFYGVNVETLCWKILDKYSHWFNYCILPAVWFPWLKIDGQVAKLQYIQSEKIIKYIQKHHPCENKTSTNAWHCTWCAAVQTAVTVAKHGTFVHRLKLLEYVNPLRRGTHLILNFRKFKIL